ncbi:MAG: hypothetical protein JWM28_2327 [Chitinophagaceae bacterium]|nr:hypothetical protein [Chitinophagaceae bacterium]
MRNLANERGFVAYLINLSDVIIGRGAIDFQRLN